MRALRVWLFGVVEQRSQRLKVSQSVGHKRKFPFVSYERRYQNSLCGISTLHTAH